MFSLNQNETTDHFSTLGDVIKTNKGTEADACDLLTKSEATRIGPHKPVLFRLEQGCSTRRSPQHPKSIFICF
jgi:hypothetical protein